MELDRMSRGVELALCVLFAVAFNVRIRVMRQSKGPPAPAGVRSAMQPILVMAWALQALAVVLWIQGTWRAFAHALTIPSLLVIGIVYALMTLDERPAEDRAKSQTAA